MQNPQEAISNIIKHQMPIDFLFKEEYLKENDEPLETRPYSRFYPEKPLLSDFSFLTPLEVVPQKINLGWIPTSSGTQLLYKGLTRSTPEQTDFKEPKYQVFTRDLDLSKEGFIEIQKEISEKEVPLRFQISQVPRFGYNRYTGSGLVEIHGWDCEGQELVEEIQIPIKELATKPWTQNYFGKPPEGKRMKILVKKPIEMVNNPPLLSLEAINERVRMVFDTRNPGTKGLGWTIDIHGSEDDAWTYSRVQPDELSIFLDRDSVVNYDLTCNAENLRTYSKKKFLAFNEKNKQKEPQLPSEFLFHSWQTVFEVNSKIFPVTELDLRIENLLESPKIKIYGKFFDLEGKYLDWDTEIKNSKLTFTNISDTKFPYRTAFDFNNGTLKFEEPIESTDLGNQKIPFSITFDENDFRIEADYHRDDWFRATV